MNIMKVILVDDESQSHKVLTKLLSKNHPEVEVVASAFSVREGIDLINQHAPDLIFLDIELPDGLGFDLLKAFDQPDFQVIFITGFDHYARTAIKFGALDYLLKPVSREELSEALSKVSKKNKEKISLEQLDILWDTYLQSKVNRLPSRLAISTSDGIIYKPVKDIVRLEAHQNYTEFTIHADHKRILASLNIGEYADQFSRYQEFMRVHRSHVINLSFVDKYVRADGGYLVLQDGAKVSVSRGYKEELLNRMEVL